MNDICSAGAVVTLSAYFAGSTLGIFTLDRIGLQILSKASEDEQERKHASESTSARIRLAVLSACHVRNGVKELAHENPMCSCRDHPASQRARQLAALHPAHWQYHCQL